MPTYARGRVRAPLPSAQVYVLLRSRPKHRTDANKSRDKLRSALKRGHTAAEQLERDIQEYGRARRHIKKAAFKVLDNVSVIDLHINLAFDITSKKIRTLPVASTGWTGMRVKHTDEEKEDHDLAWFLSHGFEVLEQDGL